MKYYVTILLIICFMYIGLSIIGLLSTYDYTDKSTLQSIITTLDPSITKAQPLQCKSEQLVQKTITYLTDDPNINTEHRYIFDSLGGIAVNDIESNTKCDVLYSYTNPNVPNDEGNDYRRFDFEPISGDWTIKAIGTSKSGILAANLSNKLFNCNDDIIKQLAKQYYNEYNPDYIGEVLDLTSTNLHGITCDIRFVRKSKETGKKVSIDKLRYYFNRNKKTNNWQIYYSQGPLST